MCPVADYFEGFNDRTQDKDPKPNASTDYMRGYCNADDKLGEDE